MIRLGRGLAGVALAVGILLPLAPLVIWSLAGRWFFPALWPQQWSLDAWRYIASPSSQVATALVTSTLLALTVVTLCIVIGLPAARCLGLYAFRGKALVEWLILLPIVVPGLVTAMGIQMLFIRYGLADTFWGVALVHLGPCLPYFVLVMAGVFANYSTELEETARTLGASPLRVFWHITLPALAPGLAVAALFTFLVSWSQYVTTLLIGGGQVVTLPLVLFPLVGAANHANAAAVSLIFVLPALVVLLVTVRTLQTDTRALGGLGRL